MTRPRQTTAQNEQPLEQYQPGLYRYLLRRLHGAPDAEDLAQLVYLRFLQAPDPSAIRTPQAYLYRIAANVLSEFVMRRRSERVTFDSPLVDELAERSAETWAGDASEELNSQQLFRNVLKELPTTHRAALVLYTQEGLTAEEISLRLNVNLQTVRKYLRQALARFRAADWNR